jgi:hypothetical protein
MVANGAMMKNPEKHKNYSRNPTTKSPESAKTQPQHDISREQANLQTPGALLQWLAKINQRHLTQNHNL